MSNEGKQQRTRSSKAALNTAIQVIADRGLSVDKVLISGGRYEIIIAGVERASHINNNQALDKWE
jgi:hypothetical protein